MRQKPANLPQNEVTKRTLMNQSHSLFKVLALVQKKKMAMRVFKIEGASALLPPTASLQI